MALDLETYRRRMEGFSEALSRESYEGRAGLKERVSYAAVYEAYADLFTREAVDALSSAVQSAEGRESGHRLKLLLESVTLAYISNRTRKLREDAENFEAAAEVKLPGGEKLPYRASAVRMLNEPDRETRRRLEDARGAVVLKKNEFLEPIHRDLHALAGELGYGSYLDMLGTIKSYPLEPVRDAMREEMARDERVFVMGEDIGARGGVFLATDGLIDEFGEDHILMATDYPHFDSEYPHTVSKLQANAVLSDTQKEKILGENARKLLHV